ncbi:MAG: endonuclease MutS2, partial [Bacteroidales bacterium]|nr:endonuclease MutS2 [Bacteroidales bacterium]
MIYPSSFEAKIGFDQIRSLLRDECISNMGKELVEKMVCCFDYNRLSVLLEQTKEFQSVLLYEDSFQAQDFYDLRQSLSPLKIEGTFIEIEDLAQLRSFVHAIMQTVVYFRIRHEDGKFPQLWLLCEDVFLEKTLFEAINKIIDGKGNLRDNASEELRRIRREIIKISDSADKKIGKLLAAAKQDGIVKEDAEMTVRNGRLCIPVTAAYKRRLKGFVHDESATGQTVFIEPAEVFDANNEIRDLLNGEKREIIRILTEITNTIRPSIPNLIDGHSFLGTIDFIRAKAKLAIKIDGVVPYIENNPVINWQTAIHPILYLNFKENKKTVIPLDIQLSTTSRILIISGPNAGGKSVCLKTVGLLQYMMQFGLAVSMKETSEMGIFTDFFIDIGDEQSIDNDLSTYSSHLLNLKTMVEHLNGNSLFLIDEFGSGTEPSLGAAMAESVLERFYELKAFGIITTHFGNLKTFSDLHPEAINGAMLFDMEALKPLFMLRIGKQGSSFTYEIARQIGFPEDIVQQAIQKSGTAQIDYEKKLEEIELEKIKTDKLLKQVNSAEEQLAAFITEYANKHHELETERKEILHAAKEQANSIIESANKLIEKTIREIK